MEQGGGPCLASNNATRIEPWSNLKRDASQNLFLMTQKRCQLFGYRELKPLCDRGGGLCQKIVGVTLQNPDFDRAC